MDPISLSVVDIKEELIGEIRRQETESGDVKGELLHTVSDRALSHDRQNGDTKESDTTYNCGICHQYFKERKALDQHTMTTHKTTSVHRMCYDCGICNKQFSTDTICIEHMMLHFTEGLFDCDTCEKQFTDLKCHIVKRHLDGRYRCETCEKEFKQRSELEAHVKESHSEKENPIECDVVNKHNVKTESMEELYDDFNDLITELTTVDRSVGKHISIKERPYIDLFMKSYDANDPLETGGNVKCHEQNDDVYFDENQPSDCATSIVEQSTDKPSSEHELFKCDICNNTFKSSSSLRRHKRLHTGVRPYKCFVCCVDYCDPSNYKNHMRNKHNINPPPLISRHFMCYICNKNFTSQSALRRHQVTHLGLYKCSVCDQSFSFASSLKTHMSLKHYMGSRSSIEENNEDYKCDICNKTFAFSSSLKRHKIIHSGLRPFVCTVCNRDFSDLSSCRAHMRGVHKMDKQPDAEKLKKLAKLYTCDICNETFNRKSSIIRHIAGHAADNHAPDVDESRKLYPCVVCTKTFTLKSSLKRHSKEHYKCKICGKVYSSESNLGVHMNYTHKSSVGQPHKVYKCDICNKTFSFSGSLKRHKIIHSGLRPFVCTVCGRDFNDLSSCRVHMRRVHKLEKQPDIEEIKKPRELYTCNTCNQKFVEKSSLVNHMAIHEDKYTLDTEESRKRDSCDVCHKTFAGPGNLRRHKVIHSGIRPFVCTVCGRGFSDLSSCRAHMRGVHKMDKQPDAEQLKKLAKLYTCDICNETFNMKSSIIRHIAGHAADNHAPDVDESRKLYPCVVCTKTFTLKSSLKRHSKEHYKCKICGKVYSSESNLGVHMNYTHKSSVGQPHKVYKCDICNKTFSFSGSLKRHKIIHSGLRPFVCTVCGRGFSDLSSCRVHMRRIHKLARKPDVEKLKKLKERYTCDVCNITFGKRISIIRHVAVHFNNYTFKCALCGKGFMFTSEYKRHMYTHKYVKCECEICNEKFDGNESLADHLTTHTKDEKHFRCETCDEQFILRNYLQRHIKQIHECGEERQLNVDSPVEKPFNCVLCNDRFALYDNYVDHVRSHTISRELTCKYCDKKFSNRIILAAHLRTHTGERPFKCSVCGKCFNCYPNYLKHKKIHNRQTYKCGTCKRFFIKRETLDSHLSRMKHYLTKPNVSIVSCDESLLHGCQLCNKWFVNEKYLKNHLAAHSDVKPYKCEICKETFVRDVDLQSHFVKNHNGSNVAMYTPHSRKLYTCDICNKTCRRRHTIINHLKRHDVKRVRFSCDICNKSMTTSASLKGHKRIVHNRDHPYRCALCDKGLRTKGLYKRHLMIEHRDEQHPPLIDESTFECDMCGVCFKDKHNLIEHIGTHNGELPYECEICDKKFAVNDKLAKHLSTHLIDEKPFECEVCNEKFIMDIYLQRHIKMIHVDGKQRSTSLERKRFKCALCNLGLQSSASYKRHVLLHTGIKPYKCDFCDKTFPNESYLLSHQRSHTDEKYTCHICNVSFTRKANFLRHKRFQHRVLPLKCNICHKRFPQMGLLELHMRHHNGVKPFKCGTCTSAYSSRCSLLKHLREYNTHKPVPFFIAERMTGTNTDRQILLHKSLKDFEWRRSDNDRKIKISELIHCKVCEKSFLHKKNYLNHMMMHKGECVPLNCDICNRSFLCMDSLTRHKLMHSQRSNPHKCTQCDRFFDDKVTYRRHMILRHKMVHNVPKQTSATFGADSESSDVTRFECDMCGNHFKDKQKLIRHIGKHGGDLLHKCKICKLSFNMNKYLASHLTTHANDERPFRCETCNEAFILDEYLQSHIKQIHVDGGEQKRRKSNSLDGIQFVCVLCNEVFTSKCHYTRHVRKHTTYKSYVCEFCGKTFSQQTNLSTHQRTHTGERPFKCSTCGKDFGDYANLLRHTKIHTGVKKHECDICHKQFIQSCQLTSHRVLHTGIKPYKCQLCEKTYAAKKSLNNHIRKHFTNCPFACDLCDKSYLRRESLREHVKKVHDAVKPFKCNICSKRFYSSDFLNSHYTIHPEHLFK